MTAECYSPWSSRILPANNECSDEACPCHEGWILTPVQNALNDASSQSSVKLRAAGEREREPLCQRSQIHKSQMAPWFVVLASSAN
mmetsp:Transcript_83620/g.270259  ORF Transcript_83620/g.270259 Transcript_83620/m.270259 type:complete len:86 (-) Transcript_83620:543-800(-)